MKTINQVLLALLFVAFSTVGFAQSQITIPSSTVKLNDDIRFVDYTDNDEDDDDDSDDIDIMDGEVIIRAIEQNRNRNEQNNFNYAIWIPNRD